MDNISINSWAQLSTKRLIVFTLLKICVSIQNRSSVSGNLSYIPIFKELCHSTSIKVQNLKLKHFPDPDLMLILGNIAGKKLEEKKEQMLCQKNKK